MCISSIMAIVDGEAGSAVAMHTALRVGEVFNAYTALMQVLPPLTTSSPMCREVKEQQVVDRLQNKAHAMNERQRERFQHLYEDAVVKEGILSIAESRQLAKTTFSATKLMIIGHENQEVAIRGRLFDIIVMPPASEIPGGARNATLEAALLDTGRPVLIASRKTPFKTGQHVTIAWDGSRHAAISIRNALPIIKRAKRVDIIHAACGEVPSNSVESVADYLHLHGILAHPHEHPADDMHPSDIIIESAIENSSAIIVVLDISVLRDRNPVYTQLQDGSIQNAFEFKILNKARTGRAMYLEITSPEGATMKVVGSKDVSFSKTQVFKVRPDTLSSFRLLVKIPPENITGEAMDLNFALKDYFTNDSAVYESIFRAPVK